MLETPLVSVIIPAYNHEKYIQDTIKSIINQTYNNIELIIIDDGSPDNTWEKIQELKDECENIFKRVVFKTKKNSGMEDSLNIGVSLAQGEYIFIIASDDIAKPELIETEVNFLIKNPEYSLCTCNDELIDSEGKVCYWDKKRNIVYDKKNAKYKTFVEYLKKYNPYFNDKDFGTYRTLYATNYIPNGYVVKKEVYNKIGKYPEGILEDWWFMLQFSKYYKMKYIDKILFSYRWHDSNSIKNNERMHSIAIKTLNWEQEFLNNADTSQFLPEVKDIKENGVVLKKRGIPYIFEIKKIKKYPKIIREVRILNKTISKTEKEI